MRDCYDHLIIGIEILRVEVARCAIVNLATALVTILLLYLVQLILDNLLAKFLIGQDCIIVLYLAHEFIILCMQLVLLNACKLCQTHLDNCSSLNLRESETFHKCSSCISRRLGSLYQAHNLVDVVRSNYQAFYNVRTLFGLTQFILGTTDNDLMTVFHEAAYALLQREKLRTATYKSNTVHAE